MTLTKTDQGYVLEFKGFKIPVKRIELIKLRNFLNQNINEMEDT